MLSVIHLRAPKSHSQSVGLPERYVKPFVDGLKVTIMGQKLPQEDWDLVVDPVIHTINTRVLCVDGLSPAELLLGYNPRRTCSEVSPHRECAVAAISTSMILRKDLWEKAEDLVERQLEPLMRLDHIQMEAATKIDNLAEKWKANQNPGRYTAPGEED